MKGSEIPKFKEFGIQNPINIGFISYVDFIKNEIEQYNLQMNPDFQRGMCGLRNSKLPMLSLFSVVENQAEIFTLTGIGIMMNTYV